MTTPAAKCWMPLTARGPGLRTAAMEEPMVPAATGKLTSSAAWPTWLTADLHEACAGVG